MRFIITRLADTPDAYALFDQEVRDFDVRNGPPFIAPGGRACPDHHAVWVARTPSGEVAAYSMWRVFRRRAFLSCVIVGKAFRGHGLMRRLIEIGKRWAGRSQIRRLTTKAQWSNGWSVRTILNSGFLPTRRCGSFIYFAMRVG